MFSPLGCKDIGIRKIEFGVKTQNLFNTKINTFSKDKSTVKRFSRKKNLKTNLIRKKN